MSAVRNAGNEGPHGESTHMTVSEIWPLPGEASAPLVTKLPIRLGAVRNAAEDVRACDSPALENSVNQARWILVPVFALWVVSFAAAAILA